MYKSLHMAGLEPQKGKPPSADAKKKTLILDEHIGDKMDISFHPGPKSKNKVFDSEKLDMDFGLDGDLTSFKMDMPDFDLSSLPKIDAKTKEVDMSDLDSSNSPKKASKVDLAEGISTLDGESETSGNFKLPPGPRCQEKIMTKSIEESDDSDQESHLPEKATSTEPYARQTTHDFPGELVGGVDSNGDDVSNGRNDGCPQITILNTILSGKEDVNDKMMIGDGPNHQPSPFKIASSLDIGSSGSCNGDKSMSDTDILAENDEPAKGDLDIGKTSATLVSRKTPQDILSIKGNQNSNLKLPLSTQASESTAEKFKLRNESRAGEFYSKISKRLEDTGPQLNQPPLIGAPFLSSGNNTKFVTTHLRPAMEKGEGSDSDGVPNRTKLLGNSQLCDKEGTYREPVVGSERRESLKDLWNIGGNKVSLNAAPPKQVKSWRSSEQNKELQGNVEMKIAEIVDGREKMPQNLPLKQKKIEGLNPGLASLKPLKHLSLSPREAGSSSTSKYAGELHWSSQSHYLSQNTCRNFKEPSKGVVEQEACPNLIQRFKEREENVEMDVFNRFTKLLQQSGKVTNGQICISEQRYENFDLNSSLTARENNPNNDQESSKEVASDGAGPKGKKIGTTIIAVVCKKRILIASDGRQSSAEEDTQGLILTGVGQKIFQISPHIFASISGDINACEHMDNTVRNAVLRSSNDLTMSVVEEECKTCMNSWKRHYPKDEFPGTVLIYGYSEGHASIYSAGIGEQIESHRGVVVGSGSGFGKAKEYLVEQLEKRRRRSRGEPTEKEYRKMLKTAVAVAALQDSRSGGFACFAAVRKGKKGEYYEERDHMLRILKKNCDEVQTYLSKAFMLVSHDMAYSLSTELPFNRLIESVFDRVESAHIISVAKNPKIIVRVIMFEDADARSSSHVHPGNNVTTFSREDGVKVELFVPTRDMIARLCKDLTAGVGDF